MRKTALAVALLLLLASAIVFAPAFSTHSKSPVTSLNETESPNEAEQWSTIEIPTRNLAPLGTPYISDDGNKIAFYDSVDENLEIFIVNCNGTGLKQLTSNSRQDLQPSISGDGNKIAFFSYVPLKLGSGEPFVTDPKLFVVNSDGTELTSLLSDSENQYPLRSHRPSISHDGTKVAFVANIVGWDRGFGLFVVNSDGTGLTKLSEFALGMPSISGDGRKIAFSASVKEGEAIFVVNSDRTGLTKLAPCASKSYGGWLDPSISGDGNKIAFSSYSNGDHEIFVVNSDGTGLKQLTNNTVWDVNPSINSDGNKIAFFSHDKFHTFEKICVIDSDGTGLKQIYVSKSCLASAPSISGDGSKVAYKDGGRLFVSVKLDVVLSPSPLVSPTPEPFATAVIAAASLAIGAAVGAGLLVYFKRRRAKPGGKA